MTFIDAAILVLKENDNKAMSCKEIWDIIKERDLVKTAGKTPQLSLNTIILVNCIDSPVSKPRGRKKPVFKIESKSPNKYSLINFLPQSIKNILLEDGFITMDILIDILAKNNIDIKL